jgi:hypothetical protein
VRDAARSINDRIMVLRKISVESSAKIAMTAPPNGFAAMPLLSNHDLPRSHCSRGG